MKGIIILASTLMVFLLGFYAMKELSSFMKQNRKGRKHYEYYFTDEEED